MKAIRDVKVNWGDSIAISIMYYAFNSYQVQNLIDSLLSSLGWR